MKIFIKIFPLFLLMCCTTNKNEERALESFELNEVGSLAVNKPIEAVLDSLNINTEDLYFTEDPPRIVSSLSFEYQGKGTIEFTFEGTSFILDTVYSKEHYLDKVANKIVQQVEWLGVDGKRGSLKNIKMY